MKKLVSYDTDDLQLQAKSLAKQLEWPLCNKETIPDKNPNIVLMQEKDQLVAWHYCNKQKSVIALDFNSPKMRHRLQQGKKHKENIIKAIGLHKRPHLKVIDATAGFGQDAYIMAHYGAKITLIEQNPLMHILLEDALRRAQLNPQSQQAVSRIQLVHGDAKSLLRELDADLIYLDPMFPEKTKNAKSQKNSAFLQDLIGPGAETNTLLDIARECAPTVVYKHPLRAALSYKVEPHHIIKGPKHAFVVYQQ